MAFKKGQSGNPAGKPIGAVSGITKAKTIILAVFNKHSGEFKRKLDAAATKNPIGFYLKFVQPFMPKDLNIEVNDPGGENKRQQMLDKFSEIEEKLAGKTAKNGQRSGKKKSH